MTNYIDPSVSDEEFIGRDTRLSRKQADRDYAESKAKDGLDAAIFSSRHGDRPAVEDGFKKIPGASRSGAISPVTRSQMLKQERDGLVELQRDAHGHLIAYRPINHESKED